LKKRQQLKKDDFKMTNKEIEKRLDALESRITPKGVMSIWVCFFEKEKKAMTVKGWKYEDQIFLREPGETDDALRDRVLSLTEKYKNPPSGQVFISIV
jgi:hypothetical protein